MHSWTRLCEILRLSCHRPTVRETSIHVCLLSDVQAWFCERVDTILLDQEDYTFTNEFCTAMSNVYPSEEERTVDINHRLSEYFGEPIGHIWDDWLVAQRRGSDGDLWLQPSQRCGNPACEVQK
jgi:hypothetical protein